MSKVYKSAFEHYVSFLRKRMRAAEENLDHYTDKHFSAKDGVYQERFIEARIELEVRREMLAQALEHLNAAHGRAHGRETSA